MRRVAACLLLWFAFAPPLFADDWGPWETQESRKVVAKGSEDFHPLKWGIRFFQRYISVVDGPRCPMTPTCSTYALQALDKHGVAMGTFMTVDRLYHESNPREHRHPVPYADRVRFFDPLENNDFWFNAK